MIRVKRTPATEFFHSETYERIKNSLTTGFTEATKKKRQSGYGWGDEETIVFHRAGSQLREMLRGRGRSGKIESRGFHNGGEANER